MYHGTPAERAELRRTVMPPPGTPAAQRSKPSNAKSNKSKSKSKSSRSKSRKSSKYIVIDDTTDEEEEEEEKGDDKEEESYLKSFPIVVTTYEIIIRDRAVLAPYQWGYIVVDEGHRLKNLDCKLMREIKKYQSAGRMILTGTPLQVSHPSPPFFF